MTLPNLAATGLPAELRQRLLNIVAQRLAGRHYRLYLFGSRARGTATVRSDYDLGVQTEAPLDLATLAHIRGDLEELPILQRVEFVDFSSATPDFMRRALQNSELLDEH